MVHRSGSACFSQSSASADGRADSTDTSVIREPDPDCLPLLDAGRLPNDDPASFGALLDYATVLEDRTREKAPSKSPDVDRKKCLSTAKEVLEASLPLIEDEAGRSVIDREAAAEQPCCGVKVSEYSECSKAIPPDKREVVQHFTTDELPKSPDDVKLGKSYGLIKSASGDSINVENLPSIIKDQSSEDTKNNSQKQKASSDEINLLVNKKKKNTKKTSKKSSVELGKESSKLGSNVKKKVLNKETQSSKKRRSQSDQHGVKDNLPIDEQPLAKLKQLIAKSDASLSEENNVKTDLTPVSNKKEEKSIKTGPEKIALTEKSRKGKPNSSCALNDANDKDVKKVDRRRKKTLQKKEVKPKNIVESSVLLNTKGDVKGLEKSAVAKIPKKSNDNAQTKKTKAKVGKDTKSSLLDMKLSLPDILQNENKSVEIAKPKVEELGLDQIRRTSAVLTSQEISVRCRLPLSKLRRILHKIKPLKKSLDSSEPNVTDNNDSALLKKHEINSLTISAGPDVVSNFTEGKHAQKRFLCLYCDRSFVTASLQIRHVQRVHKDSPSRRSSGRSSVSLTKSSDSKEFVGCGFCSTEQTRGVNLKELFLHMSDRHSDKYFACTKCCVRFPSSDRLNIHLSEVHGQKADVSRSIKDLSSDAIDFEQSIAVNVVSLAEHKGNPKIIVSEPSRTKGNQKSSGNANSSPQNEPMLSRLGITQNRSPGGKKSTSKNRKSTDQKSPMSNDKKQSKSKTFAQDPQEFVINKNINSKNELFDSRFDKDFYQNVTSNVCENLALYLDGKINNITGMCKVEDSEPPLNSSSLPREVRIHESNTSLTAVTTFPTLLASEQYGATGLLNNLKLPRKKATKNSWKWKFDFVKKYKYYNENGKMVKKIKPTNLGSRDLSKLDMWTQLTMKNKYDLEKIKAGESKTEEEILVNNERNEKVRLLNELNSILDTRLFPKLHLEQEYVESKVDVRVATPDKGDEIKVARRKSSRINDICANLAKGSTKVETEDLVKREPSEDKVVEVVEDNLQSKIDLTLSQDICLPFTPLETTNELLLISDYLQLSTNNKSREIEVQTNSEVFLSGEWARPRCYVCVGCGKKLNTLKELEDHKTSEHAYTYSTYYEIIGKEMIESEVYRLFHLPGSHNTGKLLIDEKQKESIRLESNESKAITSFTNCTKCTKELKGDDFYRHLLECAGDAWLLSKKKSRYRPFGTRSRRRRARLNGCKPSRRQNNGTNSNSTGAIAKKLRRKVKAKSGPRPKPSDAETIQRMLANLPAKRLSKHIVPLPQGGKPVQRLNRNQNQNTQRSNTRHALMVSGNNLRSSRSRPFLHPSLTATGHKPTWTELQRLKNTKQQRADAKRSKIVKTEKVKGDVGNEEVLNKSAKSAKKSKKDAKDSVKAEAEGTAEVLYNEVKIVVSDVHKDKSVKCDKLNKSKNNVNKSDSAFSDKKKLNNKKKLKATQESDKSFKESLQEDKDESLKEDGDESSKSFVISEKKKHKKLSKVKIEDQQSEVPNKLKKKKPKKSVIDNKQKELSESSSKESTTGQVENFKPDIFDLEATSTFRDNDSDSKSDDIPLSLIKVNCAENTKKKSKPQKPKAAKQVNSKPKNKKKEKAIEKNPDMPLLKMVSPVPSTKSIERCPVLSPVIYNSMKQASDSVPPVNSRTQFNITPLLLDIPVANGFRSTTELSFEKCVVLKQEERVLKESLNIIKDSSECILAPKSTEESEREQSNAEHIDHPEQDFSKEDVDSENKAAQPEATLIIGAGVSENDNVLKINIGTGTKEEIAQPEGERSLQNSFTVQIDENSMSLSTVEQITPENLVTSLKGNIVPKTEGYVLSKTDTKQEIVSQNILVPSKLNITKGTIESKDISEERICSQVTPNAITKSDAEMEGYPYKMDGRQQATEKEEEATEEQVITPNLTTPSKDEISPCKTPSKRRSKKLTDCIAMLTDKLNSKIADSCTSPFTWFNNIQSNATSTPEPRLDSPKLSPSKNRNDDFINKLQIHREKEVGLRVPIPPVNEALPVRVEELIPISMINKEPIFGDQQIDKLDYKKATAKMSPLNLSDATKRNAQLNYPCAPDSRIFSLSSDIDKALNNSDCDKFNSDIDISETLKESEHLNEFLLRDQNDISIPENASSDLNTNSSGKYILKIPEYEVSPVKKRNSKKSVFISKSPKIKFKSKKETKRNPKAVKDVKKNISDLLSSSPFDKMIDFAEESNIFKESFMKDIHSDIKSLELSVDNDKAPSEICVEEKLQNVEPILKETPLISNEEVSVTENETKEPDNVCASPASINLSRSPKIKIKFKQERNKKILKRNKRLSEFFIESSNDDSKDVDDIPQENLEENKSVTNSDVLDTSYGSFSAIKSLHESDNKDDNGILQSSEINSVQSCREDTLPLEEPVSAAIEDITGVENKINAFDSIVSEDLSIETGKSKSPKLKIRKPRGRSKKNDHQNKMTDDFNHVEIEKPVDLDIFDTPYDVTPTIKSTLEGEEKQNDSILENIESSQNNSIQAEIEDSLPLAELLTTRDTSSSDKTIETESAENVFASEVLFTANSEPQSPKPKGRKPRGRCKKNDQRNKKNDSEHIEIEKPADLDIVNTTYDAFKSMDVNEDEKEEENALPLVELVSTGNEILRDENSIEAECTPNVLDSLVLEDLSIETDKSQSPKLKIRKPRGKSKKNDQQNKKNNNFNQHSSLEAINMDNLDDLDISNDILSSVELVDGSEKKDIDEFSEIDRSSEINSVHTEIEDTLPLAELVSTRNDTLSHNKINEEETTVYHFDSTAAEDLPIIPEAKVKKPRGRSKKINQQIEHKKKKVDLARKISPRKCKGSPNIENELISIADENNLISANKKSTRDAKIRSAPLNDCSMIVNKQTVNEDLLDKSIEPEDKRMSDSFDSLSEQKYTDEQNSLMKDSEFFTEALLSKEREINESASVLDTSMEPSFDAVLDETNDTFDMLKDSKISSDSDEDISLADIAKILQHKTGKTDVEVSDSKQDRKEERVDSVSQDLNQEINSNDYILNYDIIKSKKKRRYKKSVLYKKVNKPKIEKVNNSPEVPKELNYCDICKKSFQRLEGLAKHKMTLTHIAKLSEIEFLTKSKEKVDIFDKDMEPASDSRPDSEVTEEAKISEVVQNVLQQKENISETLLDDMNNRKALSVEEALFFECCSLLKSSEATKNEIASETQKLNNPYSILSPSDSLKLLSNHHYSNKFSDISNDSNNLPAVPKLQEDGGGNLSAFLATVDKFISAPILNHHQRDNYMRNDVNYSPISNSRGSLKYDTEYSGKNVHNNFSPISSDQSEPDVIQNNLYMKTNAVLNDNFDDDGISKDCDDNLYNDNNLIVHSNLNSYSETGDSTPPSLVNTDDEVSVQNCIENSRVFDEIAKVGYHNYDEDEDRDCDKSSKGETEIVLNNGISDSESNDSDADVDVPSVESSLHSSKKIPTKGALKVFESLKVSIPTSEFNLQKVIDSCSDSSKLAAFAEIALHREHSNQSVVKDDEDKQKSSLPSPPIKESSDDVTSDDNLIIDECPLTPGKSLELMDNEVPENITPKEVIRKEEPVTTKTRKNNIITFGNNLGFRIKKKRVNQKKTGKKTAINKKSKKNKQSKDVVKDVYDFDDSLENTDFEIDKLKGYASSKSPMKPEAKILVDEKPKINETVELSNLENTVQNSQQPSDDDDFDYISDDITMSSVESTEAEKTKLDSEGNPKRLIVGKIFRKNLKDKPEKPNLDELFDTLLCDVNEPKNQKPDNETDKKVDLLVQDEKDVPDITKDDKVVNLDNSLQVEEKIVQESDVSVKKNKKKNNRSKTIIEQELGMSFQEIKEIIGFATRKSQRKCTTGKQNILAENWSSDEELEISARRDRNRSDKKSAKENIENKSARGRKSDTVNHSKKTATDVTSKPLEEKQMMAQEPEAVLSSIPVKTNILEPVEDKEQSNIITNGNENEEKIHNGTDTTPRNKRGYRRRPKVDASSSESEDDTDRKCARRIRKKRKSLSKSTKDQNQEPSALAIEVLPEIVEKLTSDINVEKLAVGSKKRNKQNLAELDAQTAAILSLPRRKRVSTDMLYYWSSSSDEDQFAGMIEVKPIRDDVNLTEHPIQHGWIVGDSHKKLVTLLAHAKGKKTEDCAVKEGHTKKNRTTL